MLQQQNLNTNKGNKMEDLNTVPEEQPQTLPEKYCIVDFEIMQQVYLNPPGLWVWECPVCGYTEPM